jgi:hypothetical protein
MVLMFAGWVNEAGEFYRRYARILVKAQRICRFTGIEGTRR